MTSNFLGRIRRSSRRNPAYLIGWERKKKRMKPLVMSLFTKMFQQHECIRTVKIDRQAVLIDGDAIIGVDLDDSLVGIAD